MSVVVVGSLNVDLGIEVDRHPRPGETLLGRGGTLSPGGKGANQALAAARQGVPVAMIGAVGADGNAQVALGLLREAGVDLSAVETVGEPTGLAVISVDAAGQNNVVVVPGANAAVDDAMVTRHAQIVSAADVVVLQGEVPLAGLEAAARLTRGRLVLNLAPVIDIDTDLIRQANPLIVNEIEAREVLEMLAPETDVEALDDDGVALALADAGPRSLVMTLGGHGAYLVRAGVLSHVPAPRVEVVDTVGAGDAFVGALSAALSRGSSLDDAAALGVRVGSFAVGGRGAQTSYPTLDDALPASTD